ncbi:helix-turn-helix domain-containing protein [Kitasatospora sp. NBC_00374]|uniref:helix-turn-helix domain-containing protein n=1 Tax=Kitasatospora sp. NBC_00374 TaxID=2975964 RepID=UPI00325075A0
MLTSHASAPCHRQTAPFDAAAGGAAGHPPAPTRRRDSMLTRGLALLNAFGPDDLELSLSELARRADLPKPTAHRLIAELLDSGFLERGHCGLQLGPQMHLLGARSPRDQRLRILARPLLQRLHQVSGAAVYLSVPRGQEVVHLLREGAADEDAEARDWTVRQFARRLFHAVAQGRDQGLAPSGAAARPAGFADAAPQRGGVVAARRLGPAADGPGTAARVRTPPSAGPVVSLADAQRSHSVLACSVRADGAGLLAALCLVGGTDPAGRRGTAPMLRDTARELTARLAAQLDPRTPYSGTR